MNATIPAREAHRQERGARSAAHGAAAHGDQATIDAITAGLLSGAASIASKYLYDVIGSRLFEAICELPEYYPTRTEAAIFALHGADMARRIGPGATLIDLGAGNCAKAAALFPLLLPAQYVPIDIAHDFLSESVTRLRQRFPAISMTPLALDLSDEFALSAAVGAGRRLFFYPGSSIGNFAPQPALAFLRRLRQQSADAGGLLIGVDLVKDVAVLEAAYDDAPGVTAAFNLNLLRHVNHLAGTDFNPRQWRHVALFNGAESRIEMHLEARAAHTVCWPGGARRFAGGEQIHTENSYKYTTDSFTALLTQAGFATDAIWTDAAGAFAVVYARAVVAAPLDAADQRAAVWSGGSRQ
jgi:dimethylhistidine N-methyltransferase